ncbi:MAG: hypothetical protein GY777_20915 [Candidatus Brocadiaceae bacterium]|nr:hypothetical protein [Candidatus Brocadiaceae bacterium]
MSNEFKAGDFTSGKMAEIFKTCCFQDLAIINHKQFGKIYMIPEELIAAMTINAFIASPKGIEFIEFKCGSMDNFKEKTREDQLMLIGSEDWDTYNNWLEALSAVSGRFSGAHGSSKG